ncbi:MAG: PDZ domain-containing protein [Deltaproteobacteria bacterium]|nr:PDZ domain-containing protein [Deltaproteobacteria bacterium]
MSSRRTAKRSWVVASIMLLTLAWWVFGVTGTLRLGMVGVEVEDDYITRVLPDTPAERAGLRVGDRVAAIEGDEGMIEVGRTLEYLVERDSFFERIVLQAASWHGTQRNVMLATIAMGLLHLLCGAAAWFYAPGKAGNLFALFCATTAVHWSGFRPATSDVNEWAFVSVLLLGTGFAASFLLHFTLVYPRPWSLEARRVTRAVLYGPPVLAFLVAVVSVALHGGPMSSGLQAVFFMLTNIPGYLFSLLALVVIGVRIRKADATERRNSGLNVMLVGMLAAYVPYLLVMLLEVVAPSVPIPGGVGAYPYTLFFVLTPVAFLYALLTRDSLKSTVPSVPAQT